MKPLFIQYPKCGTCRKAAQWLRENGVDVEVRDIVVQNPTRGELSQWIARSGVAPAKFFNTSGLRYRELNLKDRVKSDAPDELIELLASEGMLVKRPVLVADSFVLVGFDPSRWAETVLKR